MHNRYSLTPYFLDRRVPHFMTLAGDGWTVIDPELPKGDIQDRVSHLHRPLADFVARTVAAGDRPVCFGGDCCSAIAVLAGLQRAGSQPTVIWFDAHGDFNTWETTPSGFLGGMPLAMIVGLGELRMARAVGLAVHPEASVVLSDARDLDPEERLALAGSEVVHVADIAALRDRPLPSGPLYIHIDTDVIDPAEAPAQNYPAAGGPGAADLRAVLDDLVASGRVVAVSICGWSPDRDPDRTTEKVCLDALAPVLT